MGRRQPENRRGRGQQQGAQPTLPPPCEHLPKTLQQIWQQVWNDNRCKNLSLLIDRYAPWTKVGDEWNLRMRYRRGQREETAEGQSAKGLWLRDKTDETMIHLPICPSERIDVGIFTAVKQRHEALLQWYRQQGFEVRQFEAKPVWRFVVGLGAAHVLETDITLHRIFGLPIIPASGLKGAARAYALFKLADELGLPVLSPSEAKEEKLTPLQKLESIATVFALEDDEQKWQEALDELLQDERLSSDATVRRLDLATLKEKLLPFVKVFGTTKQVGKIVFLDAVPLETPKFELDIMNPHFPQYYDKRGGDQNKPVPPADWDSPRPVFFLTVNKTPYSFAIAARTSDANDLLPTAEKWLKGALKELGVGAKTSADYGYWEVSR